jgi:hypothetical protein
MYEIVYETVYEHNPAVEALTVVLHPAYTEGSDVEGWVGDIACGEARSGWQRSVPAHPASQ